MDNYYPLLRLSEMIFPQMRDLMKIEPDSPSTYGEWVALWQRRRVEEQRRGYNVFFVDVDPDGFIEFCAAHTPPLPYIWGALTKYVGSVAAVKAGRRPFDRG
jgi:hypothetical protein